MTVINRILLRKKDLHNGITLWGHLGIIKVSNHNILHDIVQHLKHYLRGYG